MHRQVRFIIHRYTTFTHHLHIQVKLVYTDVLHKRWVQKFCYTNYWQLPPVLRSMLGKFIIQFLFSTPFNTSSILVSTGHFRISFSSLVKTYIVGTDPSTWFYIPHQRKLWFLLPWHEIHKYTWFCGFQNFKNISAMYQDYKSIRTTLIKSHFPKFEKDYIFWKFKGSNS